MSECVRVTGGRRDGRTEEEEEEEEGGADTALKTKNPHVNVGKTKKISKKLSQLRHVELANECES